jgi:hypothetical protein
LSQILLGFGADFGSIVLSWFQHLFANHFIQIFIHLLCKQLYISQLLLFLGLHRWNITFDDELLAFVLNEELLEHEDITSWDVVVHLKSLHGYVEEV